MKTLIIHSLIVLFFFTASSCIEEVGQPRNQFPYNGFHNHPDVSNCYLVSRSEIDEQGNILSTNSYGYNEIGEFIYEGGDFPVASYINGIDNLDGVIATFRDGGREETRIFDRDHNLLVKSITITDEFFEVLSEEEMSYRYDENNHLIEIECRVTDNILGARVVNYDLTADEYGNITEIRNRQAGAVERVYRYNTAIYNPFYKTIVRQSGFDDLIPNTITPHVITEIRLNDQIKNTYTYSGVIFSGFPTTIQSTVYDVLSGEIMDQYNNHYRYSCSIDE